MPSMSAPPNSQYQGPTPHVLPIRDPKSQPGEPRSFQGTIADQSLQRMGVAARLGVQRYQRIDRESGRPDVRGRSVSDGAP